MKLLIITENESSELVRIVTRHKCIPIIRRSILSALDILKHYEIDAVIIDKDNRETDPIEFLLNAGEINHKLPYFVHNSLPAKDDWKKINKLGLHIESIMPDTLEDRLQKIKHN